MEKICNIRFGNFLLQNKTDGPVLASVSRDVEVVQHDIGQPGNANFNRLHYDFSIAVLELMGPSWRVFAGMGKSYSWTTGNMVLAGIAFGIRDWFTLQLTLAAPAVILFSYFW